MIIFRINNVGIKTLGKTIGAGRVVRKFSSLSSSDELISLINELKQIETNNINNAFILKSKVFITDKRLEAFFNSMFEQSLIILFLLDQVKNVQSKDLDYINYVISSTGSKKKFEKLQIVLIHFFKLVTKDLRFDYLYFKKPVLKNIQFNLMETFADQEHFEKIYLEINKIKNDSLLILKKYTKNNSNILNFYNGLLCQNVLINYIKYIEIYDVPEEDLRSYFFIRYLYDKDFKNITTFDDYDYRVFLIIQSIKFAILKK